jgi:hypothetical protein
MATQHDIEATYDYMDEMFRLSFGDHGDITCALKLLPLYLTDKDFRYKIEAVRHTYNNECFKRDIMDHQRMVFQKRGI